MSNRFRHAEPLQLGLLIYDYQVDVIATAQTMIGDPEQTIGIGWQVDACDRAFLRQNGIDQSGSLMTKAIMIVAPTCRSQENVERGNRLAPGQLARLLQPLRVLDRHRSRDHCTGLVGGKQAMPSGEQVAL